MHISVDGYPPQFWKIIWLGSKHVDMLTPKEGNSVCLLKNVLILFTLSVICYLHGMYQVWQAGWSLNVDIQNKLVCLLLPCCGHEDTEKDFANMELWLNTSMQNFVICGFCQIFWVRLSSAPRNWTDFLAKEGFLSNVLVQWMLWQLQRLISSFLC